MDWKSQMKSNMRPRADGFLKEGKSESYELAVLCNFLLKSALALEEQQVANVIPKLKGSQGDPGEHNNEAWGSYQEKLADDIITVWANT